MDKVWEIDIPLIEEIPNNDQRSEKWFKDREGMFTGSDNHKLMSVCRTESKLDWGRPEKILSFGEAAKKYLFQKAKERQRNKVVRLPSTGSMKWGTNNETEVKRILKEKYPHFEISDTPFLKVLGHENYLGASPDGSIIDTEIGLVYGLEIKCVTGWDGLYNRTEEVFDEKHEDFWQIQTEMLSLQCDQLYYCVAEPPTDLINGTIDDITINIVNRSPIHQQALIYRAIIGNEVIKLWLKYEGKKTISTCIQEIVCTFDYRNNVYIDKSDILLCDNIINDTNQVCVNTETIKIDTSKIDF